MKQLNAVRNQKRFQEVRGELPQKMAKNNQQDNFSDEYM